MMVSIETALHLLDQARAELAQVSNIDTTHDRDLPARKAAVRRRLQYAAQITDTARLEIMNQYWLFLGEEPPEIIP